MAKLQTWSVLGWQPVYTYIRATDREHAMKIASGRKCFQGCSPNPDGTWRHYDNERPHVQDAVVTDVCEPKVNKSDA